ncbi:uridine phosphorylase 2-like [Leptopilina heterotoma]|uniref:uridine phosphorylase 2-like n=1 Tax=Leptopilina heterotoma TaxID=63436 RepID=UPI001CA90D81|nr:uridine phosphorylase 2-like [Leptopilina heterotoma]
MDAKEENNQIQRNENGLVQLQNPYIKNLKNDVLYHLGFDTSTHDLKKMFGDIKFVCTGGTDSRMKEFAYYAEKEMSDLFETGTKVIDYSEYSHRYAIFKVGPILSISHGMGVPTLSIMLIELFKLLHYAEAKDPIIIRIGSSGGIGVKPGTVVITNGALDELLRPDFEMAVAGELVKRPAIFDQTLVEDLENLSLPDDDFEIRVGKTMCANDFYEGQGRLDGAFCTFSEDDRMNYLKKLQKNGVLNIEMECVCFGALTHLAKIKSAIVCVTFLNRLEGDQVLEPAEKRRMYEARPQNVVVRYLRKLLINK